MDALALLAAAASAEQAADRGGGAGDGSDDVPLHGPSRGHSGGSVASLAAAAAAAESGAYSMDQGSVWDDAAAGGAVSVMASGFAAPTAAFGDVAGSDAVPAQHRGDAMRQPGGGHSAAPPPTAAFEPAAPAGQAKDRHAGTAVAAMYTKIARRSLGSKIKQSREVHNRIKVWLINECVTCATNTGASAPKRMKAAAAEKGVALSGGGDDDGAVLELACGKGGDLQKWARARPPVRRYVGVDITAASCRELADRILKLDNPAWDVRAKVAVADLTETDLVKCGLLGPAERFDVISIQFALHYMFSTAARARAFFANIRGRLKPGGVFCGTLPDADRVVRRMRDCKLEPASDGTPGLHGSFGNEIYRCRFEEAAVTRSRALGDDPFGIPYRFSMGHGKDQTLSDAVEEFLVPWPLLKAVAAEVGLQPLALPGSPPRRTGEPLPVAHEYHENFTDFFRRHAADPDKLRPLANRGGLDSRGSISPNAWDAMSFYCCFAFQLPLEAVATLPARVGAAGGSDPADEASIPYRRREDLRRSHVVSFGKNVTESAETGGAAYGAERQSPSGAGGFDEDMDRPGQGPGAWRPPSPPGAPPAGHGGYAPPSPPGAPPSAGGYRPPSPPGPPPAAGGYRPPSPPGPPPAAGGYRPPSPPGPPPAAGGYRPPSPPGPPPAGGGYAPPSPPGQPPDMGFPPAGGYRPPSPPGAPPVGAANGGSAPPSPPGVPLAAATYRPPSPPGPPPAAAQATGGYRPPSPPGPPPAAGPTNAGYRPPSPPGPPPSAMASGGYRPPSPPGPPPGATAGGYRPPSPPGPPPAAMGGGAGYRPPSPPGPPPAGMHGGAFRPPSPPGPPPAGMHGGAFRPPSPPGPPPAAAAAAAPARPARNAPHAPGVQLSCIMGGRSRVWAVGGTDGLPSHFAFTAAPHIVSTAKLVEELPRAAFDALWTDVLNWTLRVNELTTARCELWPLADVHEPRPASQEFWTSPRAASRTLMIRVFVQDAARARALSDAIDDGIMLRRKEFWVREPAAGDEAAAAALSADALRPVPCADVDVADVSMPPDKAEEARLVASAQRSQQLSDHLTPQLIAHHRKHDAGATGVLVVSGLIKRRELDIGVRVPPGTVVGAAAGGAGGDEPQEGASATADDDFFDTDAATGGVAAGGDDGDWGAFDGGADYADAGGADYADDAGGDYAGGDYAAADGDDYAGGDFYGADDGDGGGASYADS